MKLFAYYALHSFVNQIKKLFKTWIMIFFLVCIVCGMIIGLIVGFVADKVDPSTPDDGSSETTGGEDDPGDVITPGDEEPGAPLTFRDESGNVILELDRYKVFDLIVTGIVAFIFILMLLTMDKGSFFLPADTMLLFTSPMTPQAVLYFRLSCTMSATVFGGIYILFQIPNLVFQLGLGVAAIIAVVIAYISLLAVSMLFRVLAYVYSAADTKKQALVKYFSYGLILVILAGALIYKQASGISSIPAALCSFFTLKQTRLFPVLGWIKGMVMYAAEGNFLYAGLCFAAVVLASVLIVFIVSRMKPDFYEEAMAKSEEVAAALAAQKEKGGLTSGTKRKKDRDDRLKRDGMKHGSGANVYFFKEMYNRFRFAIFGVFTKTSLFYIIFGVGLTLILRFLSDTRSMLPAAFVIAAIAFYRTIGNPLEKDTSLHYFSTIPATAGQKLFWSLLAGMTNTALDIAVPLLVSGIIMGEGPLMIIGCFLFILSIDCYSTVVGSFINLSLPKNAGTTLKQMVQIMFLYFGILPDVVVIVLAANFLSIGAGLAIASAVNIAVAGIFFAFLPLFF